MEKVKEFISNPKKTIILGLIGCILLFLYTIYVYMSIGLEYFNFGIILDIICSTNTAFLIYFIIVAMRLYKQKGNIKVANYILLILCINCVVFDVINVISCSFNTYCILGLILSLTNAIYLYNILFKKAQIKYINNKLFAGVNIAISIYYIIRIFNFSRLFFYIVSLLTIPYFYNYYELLKGENKDGK